MAITIHPTAIVDKECELGDGTSVGPYCVLSGKIRLGKNNTLMQGVNLAGPLEAGDDNTFWPGASLGFGPQDFKFKPGMATAGVKVGSGCFFREFCTVHAATKADVPTTVGNKVMMMVSAHVGHDGSVGDNVILVNSALLAGHVQVGNNSIVSGNAAIQQFTRIGRMAMIGGVLPITKDVPHFCVVGERNTINGLNVVGLRRNGVPRDQITVLRRVFWEVLRHPMPKLEMVAKLREAGQGQPLVMEWAEFVERGTRGMCVGAEGMREEKDE